MNYTYIFRKVLLFWLVIGMVGLLYPNNTGALSGDSFDFDSLELIEINAVLSEFNVKEAYLIVGEKKAYLIEFKVGNKHYKTAFVNEMGTSYIDSISPYLWEGQRVLVRGFKLANGDIMAGVVKKVKNIKSYRK